MRVIAFIQDQEVIRKILKHTLRQPLPPRSGFLSLPPTAEERDKVRGKKVLVAATLRCDLVRSTPS